MANLNKVMLIGRLTRDPVVHVFSNGGKVAKFGFAVNNRKKNQTTGQWEDDPVFIDVNAFNRGESGKQADLVEQYLHRGSLTYVEGHLQLEQWTDREGKKCQKLTLVLEQMQFLEPRQQDGASPGMKPHPASGNVTTSPGYQAENGAEPPFAPTRESDIPF